LAPASSSASAAVGGEASGQKELRNEIASLQVLQLFCGWVVPLTPSLQSKILARLSNH
jgi:hypothetical protein